MSGFFNAPRATAALLSAVAGMKTAEKQLDLDREARQSPVVWFALLDQARESGDWKLAQQAEAELRRLGVAVRFSRPSRTGGRARR